jgi:hypothetical protein
MAQRTIEFSHRLEISSAAERLSFSQEERDTLPTQLDIYGKYYIFDIGRS